VAESGLPLVNVDLKARISASTGGIIRPSFPAFGSAPPSPASALPGFPAEPTANDILALLIILAVMQQSQADPAPARAMTLDVPVADRTPPNQVPLGLSRDAVVSYVGQAMQDQAAENVAAKALGFLKDNTEAAVAGALGIGGAGAASAAAGLQATAASLAAAAPIGIVGTVVGGLALAAFDMFGGDFSISTYATTPQLDATTALGQAAARKAAIRIKTNLAAGVGKFDDAGGRTGTLGG
jgi:hypothetical protein